MTLRYSPFSLTLAISYIDSGVPANVVIECTVCRKALGTRVEYSNGKFRINWQGVQGSALPEAAGNLWEGACEMPVSSASSRPLLSWCLEGQCKRQCRGRGRCHWAGRSRNGVIL